MKPGIDISQLIEYLQNYNHSLECYVLVGDDHYPVLSINMVQYNENGPNILEVKIAQD